MSPPLWPLCIALAQEVAPPPPPAPLVVRVSGLRNDAGLVQVYLWQQAEGFPTRAERAVQRLSAEIAGGEAELRFVDPPQGQVAVSVIHDENRNGQLDTGFLGIPEEGVGASIGPDYRRLGPPRFQDAAFELGSAGRSLDIRLSYLL